MGNLRFPYIDQSSLSGGEPNVRVPYIDQQVLKGGQPEVEIPYIDQQALKGGQPNVRVPYLFVEALIQIIPEEEMATEAFPGFGNSASNPSIPAAKDPFNTALPGLSIQVKKTPNFKTRIKEASSGHEVRNPLMSMPRWTFDLSYEFLEDRTGIGSSLKTIQGFFLSMLGSATAWLFKDPDDYLVTRGKMGDGDGTTVDFYLRRWLGDFGEIVGQVDTSNDLDVYLEYTESYAVPAAPHEVTVANVPIASAVSVYNGPTLMTRVDSAPSSGQYSVDEVTGVYTFNAFDQGQTVTITYDYLVDPADYTLQGTNRIEFDTSPPANAVAYASFQFFFVCRFLQDMADFEKFADNLWQLQTVEFKSLIR